MENKKTHTDLGRFDVIITGASFAGLALARALSLAFDGEMRIAVLDRVQSTASGRADIRAFAITAASKRMLTGLGVWAGVVEDSQSIARIEITDSSLDAGIRPLLLGYQNTLDGGEPASFIVPAASLQRELNRLASSDVSIERISPADVSGFNSTKGVVELVLKSGETLHGSLLVAADGRNSTLRSLAGLKTVSWPYGQFGIVTTIAHEVPHSGTAVQHFLPGGPFAILPLPGERSCITWSEAASEAQRVLALDDAAFLSEVDRRVGGRLGALRLDGPRQSWPLELHIARSYVAPRFAMIGDAAHIVHPIAGQGLNLALRDVAALSEVVADAVRLGLDPGNWETLCLYERWRRFDVAVSAAAFDGLNRLFSNDGTILRAVRDLGLGLVDRLPGIKEKLVEQAAGVSGELPRLLRGESI